MQEVGIWLKRLGLGQYTQSFAENGIDFSVLPELTDQHLKDLGVVLGHRLKILRAIGELVESGPSTSQLAQAAIEPAHDIAERRQLTVMFCDLVDSTALSSQMDPEDLGEVISAYQAASTNVVNSYEGLVAKYMGDGILAYFGFPRAHEDDPERAVRAGLDIIRAVTALKTKAPRALQARIGIGTGLVVVGDVIGSGEARERGIVGDTPNLAARLQGIAEPNGIAIGPSTRRLLGDLFEYKDLG